MGSDVELKSQDDGSMRQNDKMGMKDFTGLISRTSGSLVGYVDCSGIDDKYIRENIPSFTEDLHSLDRLRVFSILLLHNTHIPKAACGLLLPLLGSLEGPATLVAYKMNRTMPSAPV
ncbi:hypothetical protein ACMFMG_008182 [Clarireedia jacksonii]